MRPYWGDDYGIACCVSAMRLGKQMQFFGARVNLAKALLYAINGGRDEVSGEQVAPPSAPVTADVLDYDEVFAKFDATMEWLARTYVHAMNCIHYMHDKYFYERLEMALHDRDILRTMAFGIAGLSVVADSLSAIKHAKVHVIRDDTGLAVDYRIEGDFPKFGNADAAVDDIAADLVSRFMAKIRKHPTYRDAVHTQSVLTITSNVVYGKATGNTPDGRRKGEPFAPGANPMHGRDSHGWLASCISVARLPYADAQDGISYTVSVAPTMARRDERGRDRQRREGLRHVFRPGRLPHEPQRPLEGDAGGRDGAPGEIPAAHHPRLRLRGELRPADARAAARRDPPHLPRVLLRSGAMLEATAWWRSAAATTSAPARSPDAPETEGFEGAEETHGWVHSYETGSTVDGPGVRVMLFMSGCFLRCQYCHNPDTWHLKDGTKIELSHAIRRLRRLRAGAARHGRRPDHLGRRAAGAGRLHPRPVRRGEADGPAHRARHLGLPRPPRRRRLPQERRSGAARHQERRPGHLSPA